MNEEFVIIRWQIHGMKGLVEGVTILLCFFKLTFLIVLCFLFADNQE